MPSIPRKRRRARAAAIGLVLLAACAGQAPAGETSAGRAGAGTPDASNATGTAPAPGGDPSADPGSAAGAAARRAKPRSFTLAAAGDILLHALVIASGKNYAGGTGYDFDPMFDDVRELISSADFAICHQETPISADNTALTVPKTLSFNAPREIATALKNAGFDACDTASNHTWDRQLKGMQQTLDVLDAAGVGHSGSARSQQEADNPPIYDVKGVKVGHLAYSYTIFNNAGPNTTVPPEAPWLRSMLWPALGVDGIAADARRMRQRGAEFVVISMHWGDQYVRAPNAQQRQLAKDLLASPDIDLIIGDHVHVVQPCEKIGDKYVIYGTGNFLSNQSPTQDRSLKADNQDGSLETFAVDEVEPGRFRVTSMTFAPTWVVLPGHKVVRAIPPAYKDSYQRTVTAMGSLGPGACDATPAY